MELYSSGRVLCNDLRRAEAPLDGNAKRSNSERTASYTRDLVYSVERNGIEPRLAKTESRAFNTLAL